MQDRDTQKIRMYGNVIQVCNANKNEWASSAIITNIVDSITLSLNKINENNTLLQGDSSGTTQAKKKEKEEMVAAAIYVAAALKAMASITGNLALAADVNFSPSDILRVKETDADDICLHIHQLGTTHLAALADYDITQADLDLLAKEIKDFTDLIGKPRISIGQGKAIREEIDAIIQKTDLQLRDQLDNLMLKFSTKSPAFYSQYLSARDVSSPKSGEKGTV